MSPTDAPSPLARPAPLPRIIAVDWSGAVTGATRKLWLAECVGAEASADDTTIPRHLTPPTRLRRLESGRSRDALVAHLLDEVARDPCLVIGLDFSFSFPAWFLRDRGLADAPAAWALAARDGERWLAESVHPFWGRPGHRRPTLPTPDDHFRRTERTLPAVGGIRPKSTLQVGGAGAVGTGAIRGMPHLLALRQCGCAIWPFDPPRLPRAPLVVEIYPRLLTGPVAKGNGAARAAYLDRHHPMLPPTMRGDALASEDAFDALCSALAMARAAEQFATLSAAPDPLARLEGEIWQPRTE